MDSRFSSPHPPVISIPFPPRPLTKENEARWSRQTKRQEFRDTTTSCLFQDEGCSLSQKRSLYQGKEKYLATMNV